MTVTFRHHVDTTPAAVQALLLGMAEHVRRVARDHEELLSPAGVMHLQRCAFSLWLDARDPRTTPLRDLGVR